MAASTLNGEFTSVRVDQGRARLEPLRVVGDANDVDLSRCAVRLADLAGEE
jgi:hypothetical protein